MQIRERYKSGANYSFVISAFNCQSFQFPFALLNASISRTVLKKLFSSRSRILHTILQLRVKSNTHLWYAIRAENPAYSHMRNVYETCNEKGCENNEIKIKNKSVKIF